MKRNRERENQLLRAKWAKERDANSEWYQRRVQQKRAHSRKKTALAHASGEKKPLVYLANPHLAMQEPKKLEFAMRRIMKRSARSGNCVVTDIGTGKGGYPQMTVNGRICACAAIVLFASGRVPPSPDQQCYSHLCGNPRCVDPDHLMWETKSTNMERSFCQKRGVCGHEIKCLINLPVEGKDNHSC